MFWKRLSKWTYEELEQGLLRQPTPAREQVILDEIKRRRKKEIEKNIGDAEKLEHQRRRRDAAKRFTIALVVAALSFCVLVGVAVYNGVDVYDYIAAAAQAIAELFRLIEQYAIDVYDFLRRLLNK